MTWKILVSPLANNNPWVKSSQLLTRPSFKLRTLMISKIKKTRISLTPKNFSKQSRMLALSSTNLMTVKNVPSPLQQVTKPTSPFWQLTCLSWLISTRETWTIFIACSLRSIVRGIGWSRYSRGRRWRSGKLWKTWPLRMILVRCRLSMLCSRREGMKSIRGGGSLKYNELLY